ncbi:GXWXG protein-domain-containing protein [Scheffersomyces xylosifermentans]|uniref:GXWXG protein-domain-containing protein n=1 Tax=Scheffersomyces xylosifermentans TaxID=1304137 RepID=UPI00315D9D2D
MVSFEEISKNKKSTVEEAFQVFDALPPVKVEELIGWKWKGAEIVTGHPLEGLLDASGWFGKEFYDEDNGQPLVVYNTDGNDGDDTFPCDPLLFFENATTGKPIRGQAATLEAKGSRCRLKTILHRGETTASMFYDQTPINDTFRKVNDTTIFGVMDNKAVPAPYFFYLVKYKKL